jgi:hypothetical protein
MMGRRLKPSCGDTPDGNRSPTKTLRVGKEKIPLILWLWDLSYSVSKSKSTLVGWLF